MLKATHGFDQEHIGKIRLRIGEGITGTVAREMQPLNLANASRDPRFKVFPELNEEKYNAMLSFPITDRKDIYGVINLQTDFCTPLSGGRDPLRLDYCQSDPVGHQAAPEITAPGSDGCRFLREVERIKHALRAYQERPTGLRWASLLTAQFPMVRAFPTFCSR